jgi:hypothetical protein
MWTKRIKDIIAMLLIGDGALTLIGARNRALVWRFGPEGLRKSASWQAEHPLLLISAQISKPQILLALCNRG